jgi:hypothetical protein
MKLSSAGFSPPPEEGRLIYKVSSFLGLEIRMLLIV